MTAEESRRCRFEGAAAPSSLSSDDEDKFSSSTKAEMGDSARRVGGGVSLGDGNESDDVGEAA